MESGAPTGVNTDAYPYGRVRSTGHAWFGSMVTGGADGSGMLYQRNRYYDPTTGRFTQEDPIGLAGGMNAYGFAGGDRINFSDPLGLSPCCAELGSILTAVSEGAQKNEEALREEVTGLVVGAVAPGGGRRAAQAIRTEATNLIEQMTMKAAKSGLGREIMEGRIADATRAGFAKMEVVATNQKGKAAAIVHYWKDKASGVLSGFKFKDP
jgi:RHS repeat-associated protein